MNEGKITLSIIFPFLLKPGFFLYRYPVPPNLQIVSRRTRQFESGRPLPEEEDGSLSDRTNFYRSELSRLSSKRVVPNVAVRKREFETLEIENNKDYRRDRDMSRRPTQRESRSLDNSGKYPFNYMLHKI